MHDFAYLGSTPAEEDCEQVGPDFDRKKATAECHRYIALLKQRFPNTPPGVEFRIKWERHDFGEYPEVVVRFDNDDEAHTAYAYHVEDNLPKTWNDNTPPTRENTGTSQQPRTEEPA